MNFNDVSVVYVRVEAAGGVCSLRELEKMLGEVVVDYLKLLSRHFHEIAEQTTEQPFKANYFLA